MASNTTSTPGTGAGSHPIGKVTILNGKVQAIAPDGTVRVLGPNSIIYADERIVTDSDGAVSVMLDGPPPTQIDLGRMSDVHMTEDVYAGATPAVVQDASTDADKIQEALDKGDQPIELDATAAGGGGAGGAHPTVNFGLDGSEVTPESGAGTTGAAYGTVNPLDGTSGGAPTTAGFVDGIPTAGETAAALDEDGLVTIAADNGGPSSTTGTLPHDFGTDGAGSVSFAAMDGKTGTVGTETVTYIWDEVTHTLTASSERGEIFTVEVDPTTGEYTATLLQPVMHELGQRENDATSVLTYTVIDGNGTSIDGKLTITITDDIPVAISGQNEAGYFITTNPGETITTEFPYDADHSIVTGHGGIDHVIHAPADEWGITSNAWVQEVVYADHPILQITDPGAGEHPATEVSTPVFELAAGSDASLSFKVDLGQFTQKDGFQSGEANHQYDDTFTWNLYKLDSSDNQWDLFKSASLKQDGIVNQTWHDETGGVYRMVFSVNDMTGGNDKFTVQIDDIAVKHTTPETSTITPMPVDGHLDGSFGADGGAGVVSIAALHPDGTPIDGDGHSDTTPADGLKVTGEYGGTLTVDPSNGDYVYTPPATPPTDTVTEKFSFTIIDGDGDHSSAQLSMLIDDPYQNS